MNFVDRMQHVLYLPRQTKVSCRAEAAVRTSTKEEQQLNKPLRSEPNRAGDRQAGDTPLEARFRQAEPRLNTSRKRLIRSILENPDDTFFLSSRDLAKRYSVDAATIVRTIQALGYRKYGEFAADLRSHFVTRITPYTVLKAASREKRSLANRIQHSVEMDLRNLQHLQSTLDTEKILALAKRINSARRILIVGIDLAASLSWHLAYCLTALGLAVEAPVGSAGNVQRRVRTLNSKDLLIAISFGRCLRETVDAAQRAKKRGVPTFGITDSEQTPLAQTCDACTFVSVASPSFGGSYVAPMCLIDAILVACAHTQTARSLEILRLSQEEDRGGPRWYSAVGSSNGSEQQERSE
jgi:DNA-binding MurR/RpiR family transcriptional regulator